MQLAVVVILAAVVAAGAAADGVAPAPIDVVDEEIAFRHLPVYGAPLVGVRYGDQPADGLHTQEALGWRAIYGAPFILAVQQDERPELAAFLIKDGLRSLPHADERRFLHSYLLGGADKVGVLLSGSNFVSLPQVDMPITRFVLPARFTLAESARLHADFYSFPTLLVVNRDALSNRDLARLALVGDFTLLPDSVKVSNDLPAPAAKFGRRHTAAYSVVNMLNSAPKASALGVGAGSLGPFTAGVGVALPPFNPLLAFSAGAQ